MKTGGEGELRRINERREDAATSNCDQEERIIAVLQEQNERLIKIEKDMFEKYTQNYDDMFEKMTKQVNDLYAEIAKEKAEHNKLKTKYDKIIQKYHHGGNKKTRRHNNLFSQKRK